MKRIHKFRGWLPSINKMTYAHTLLDLIKLEIFDADIVWLEFTGNFDKNKKEIYEGDVKRETIETDGDVTEIILYYVCVYIVEWSRFAWLHLPDEYQDYLKGGIDELDYSMQETFGIFSEEANETTICGNIYESPKLLDPLNFNNDEQ